MLNIETLNAFLEFIIAECESAISVLPPESSFDLISVFIDIFSKPPELTRDDNRAS